MYIVTYLSRYLFNAKRKVTSPIRVQIHWSNSHHTTPRRERRNIRVDSSPAQSLWSHYSPYIATTDFRSSQGWTKGIHSHGRKISSSSEIFTFIPKKKKRGGGGGRKRRSLNKTSSHCISPKRRTTSFPRYVADGVCLTGWLPLIIRPFQGNMGPSHPREKADEGGGNLFLASHPYHTAPLPIASKKIEK